MRTALSNPKESYRPPPRIGPISNPKAKHNCDKAGPLSATLVLVSYISNRVLRVAKVSVSSFFSSSSISIE